MTVRLLIATAVLAVVPICAGAQSAVALSLDEAVAKGRAHSARLAESASRETAAAAVQEGRRALAQPTAALTAGYVRTNHVDEFGIPQANGTTRVIFPDIPDNLRVRAEVMWPVWTSGQVKALTEAAGADLAAATADRLALEADVALEVAVAYWQLVTTRAAVQVLDDAVARTEAWVSDVRARVAAGVSSPHEIPQATAQRARQQVQRLQARQAATLAQRELVRLTGLPPGARVDVTSPLDVARVDSRAAGTDAIPALYARALSDRTERAAMSRRAEMFRASGRAALATLRPRVSALAAIEPARPNARFVPRSAQWHTGWDLGVNVSWSLWDGGRAKADRAVALAQAQALSHRQRDFDSRLEVEIAQRVLDIETGRAAVEAAQEAVAASEEVHRVMRVRVDAGVATSTEVLDAQLAWMEAALERTRLLAALRLAESRLQRAVGGSLQ